MFSPSLTVIDAFVAEVLTNFQQEFPREGEVHAGLLQQATRSALETLASTDCSYHDMEHTILVTDVGQTILKGRMMSQGDVSPEDWVHCIIAMLHHDIGFIRGLLKPDRPGRYVINEAGDTVEPPVGATDAYLGPYHVTRSRLFVEERFATEQDINVQALSHYVEMTRFPVPDDATYTRVGDFAGLVRAADLIGQLADPHYILKLSKLYSEFKETGETRQWAYRNAGDLRADYPAFFLEYVRPYISEGLRFLRKTQDGQIWIANLFRHVHSEQTGEPSNGPEPITNPAHDIDFGSLEDVHIDQLDVIQTNS